MPITLIKTKPVSGAYLGGHGVDRRARYSVKGHEHISIKPLRGGLWMARDDTAGKVLAMDRTLGMLRLNLEEKLNAHGATADTPKCG